MLEALKRSRKIKLILTFIFYTIRYLAEYGISLAFAFFVTAPLTEIKVESLIIVLVILFIIYLIVQYGYFYNAEVFYYQLEIDTQKVYFDKLTKMDNSKIGIYNTGFISSLINEHAMNTTWVISDVAEIYTPLLIGVGSFLFITFSNSFILGIISLVSFILIIVIRYYMNKKKQKLTAKFYESQSVYKGNLIDFISNIKTVIKLSSEDFAYDKVKEAKEKCIIDKEVETKYYAYIQTVFDTLTNGLYIILLLFTLKDLNNGIDVMGTLMFYLSVMGKIIMNLKDASKSIGRILNYQTSKNKLNEVIGELHEKELSKKFTNLEIIDGKFSYPNTDTIISIPNFKINKKDKISIIGESGQGKSTLLNILTGIYDLNDGKFLIDSKEQKDSIIDAVYVSQEIEVFNLTIRENLLLGKDIKEEKIIELFKEAGLYDWYINLPNGLDEFIGEKGVKVSVGQKQRLNIIRGILNNKELYIFDEPTSNLDEYSEQLIIKLIKKYLKDKTMIIVTHRKNLISLCNKHFKFSNHTLKEVGE